MLNGSRKPNKSEKEKYYTIYNKRYGTKLKATYAFGILFLFISILTAYYMVLHRHLQALAMSIGEGMIAAGFAGLTYFCHKMSDEMKELLSKIKEGNFTLNHIKGYEAKKSGDKYFMKLHKGAEFDDTWYEIEKEIFDAFNESKDNQFYLLTCHYKDFVENYIYK